jgi:hypothetical protein
MLIFNRLYMFFSIIGSINKSSSGKCIMFYLIDGENGEKDLRNLAREEVDLI